MQTHDDPTAAPPSLTQILAALRHAARGERISVRDILTEVGDRSFATALLIPALILVSPLSGIPGVPTIGAAIVLTIVVQWIVGRDHLWLPDLLLRRTMRSDRMVAALAWLERPAAWIDRRSRQRLGFLTEGPPSILAILTIAVVAGTWPILEILPLVTTVGAFTVALFAFGMMTRDGAFMLAGYALIGVLGLFAAKII